MREEKLVYVPMAVDILHPGHINIIKVSQEYGRVMVGLFTDEAIDILPQATIRHIGMNYEQRENVVSSIRYVSNIIPQETKDYEPNLRKLKPDYMVHGTDWREGPLADVREKAIQVLAEWGGRIIEPEYTQGVSSSLIQKQIKERN